MENVITWLLPVLALASAVVVGLVLIYLIYLAIVGTVKAFKHDEHSPRLRQ